MSDVYTSKYQESLRGPLALLGQEVDHLGFLRGALEHVDLLGRIVEHTVARWLELCYGMRCCCMLLCYALLCYAVSTITGVAMLYRARSVGAAT